MSVWDWGRPSTARPLHACLAVFLVAAALYLPTLRHDFVWDDRSILMANRALSDWSKLADNLTSSFFHESSGARPFDYWRPLVVFSHMVDRSLFGNAAWGAHLVNLLLHATTSAFVLLLAYSWRPHIGFALVAGLAFAAHPVHVEAVAWVSGRSDLLFGVFFSLALLADRLYGSSGRRRWLAGSLACFLAALSSKEAAIVFPALVAARAVLTDQEGTNWMRWRRAFAASLAPLVALALFLWIRFGLVAASLPATVSDSAQRSALFWTWWSAFLRYIELLVLPAKLTILHDLELAEVWWTPRVLAGVLVFAVLAGVGWRLRGTPEAAFGIATLLVGLAPLSSFVFPVSAQGGADFPLAERFLYAPSIGFCLFAAWIFASWLPSGWPSAAGRTRLRRALGLVPFLLIAVAAARAAVRIDDWKSDLSLFSTAVRDSSESHLAHLNYAAALSAEAAQETEPENAKRTLASAHDHYLEALKIAPDNYRIHYDLGNVYQTLGRDHEAEAAYRRALLLNPGLPQARINLGAILAQSGDLEAALAQFEAAEELLARAAAPKVNKGHVLQMLGRPEEAIPVYLEALALEPGLAAALEGLEQARRTVEKAD